VRCLRQAFGEDCARFDMLGVPVDTDAPGVTGRV
jgi:hypothetical protein